MKPAEQEIFRIKCDQIAQTPERFICILRDVEGTENIESRILEGQPDKQNKSILQEAWAKWHSD